MDLNMNLLNSGCRGEPKMSVSVSYFCHDFSTLIQAYVWCIISYPFWLVLEFICCLSTSQVIFFLNQLSNRMWIGVFSAVGIDLYSYVKTFPFFVNNSIYFWAGCYRCQGIDGVPRTGQVISSLTFRRWRNPRFITPCQFIETRSCEL